MTVKTEYKEILEHAANLHERTGGAPVEVRDGARAVKIGPWPDKETRGALSALLPMILALFKKGDPGAPPSN